MRRALPLLLVAACAGGSTEDGGAGASAAAATSASASSATASSSTTASSGGASASSSTSVTGGMGGAGGSSTATGGMGGAGGATGGGATGGGGSLVATCVADATIACGDTLTGNASSEDETIDKYGPACNDWGASQKDRLWSFVPSATGMVTATITADSGADDFDLMILDGVCHPDACFDKSVNIGSDSVTFNAQAGTTYVLAVEFNGYQSAQGGYQLTLSCP